VPGRVQQSCGGVGRNIGECLAVLCSSAALSNLCRSVSQCFTAQCKLLFLILSRRPDVSGIPKSGASITSRNTTPYFFACLLQLLPGVMFIPRQAAGTFPGHDVQKITSSSYIGFCRA
jgi:hypothetical protein